MWGGGVWDVGWRGGGCGVRDVGCGWEWVKIFSHSWVTNDGLHNKDEHTSLLKTCAMLQ